ncbi:septum site-determining protein Ssd, partial [Aeromicrobium sp.]|uniref:septum site-determining protein Ssd n=1 Tax=Aeromicrobium sp. TaxID=1871063 RepID=UPI003D6C40E5
MDLALPLIATADDRMLDDALRWCAAVGCTPEVAPDVAAARRSWRGAPVVMVGDDLAPELVRAQLPRRDHVLLLARSPGEAWPLAVALGAVDVVTGDDEVRALDALTLALDGRGEACLVSVVGGVGGSGASTLAASLALAGADRGLQSLLLDADPLGGGLELLLGTESVDGLRWHDLGVADGPVAAESLADVLPRRDGLATLSWGRDGPDDVPQALGGVLAAAVRGFDLVVADVPRHL